MTTLAASATISDRFAAASGRYPMSGVQALVRLILDVRRADRALGLDTAAFVSGYEGSPLAGLDPIPLSLLTKAGVTAARNRTSATREPPAPQSVHLGPAAGW